MAESEVVRIMRTFKRDLAHGERAQQVEMARRWLAVERRLMGQMEATAFHMTELHGAGSAITSTMLMNDARYQTLMVQLREELSKYTDYANGTITERQGEMTTLGVQHSTQAILSQGPGVAFNRLPVSAVEHMVGLAGDGSPLHTLLVQSWPLSAQGMTQALVDGVALGYNPRKTAKLMAQGATGSLNRMLLISRTETLRTYKATSLEAYKTSGVVIGTRRLSTHDRRCCAACIMDEGHFYPLDEEMPEHPAGRCVGIPVVRDAPPIEWQKGQEWFETQDADVQQDILGKGTYAAWKDGQFALPDLVTVKPNAVWGPSVQVTPLNQLMGPKLPPVTLQAPPPLRPAGTPTSSALTVGKGKNKAALDRAISAIDQAHGDGNLQAIPIQQNKMSSMAGNYQYQIDGKAVKIQITTTLNESDAAHTVTHEIGHFIDQQVLKVSGQRTNSPEVQAWQDAVTNSRAVKQLQEWNRSGGTYRAMTPLQGEQEFEVDRRYIKYLLRKDELWARSYAQYVQYKTRDPLLTAGLRQSTLTQMGANEQWTDDDFAPIAEAIDKLLQAAGWLQ